MKDDLVHVEMVYDKTKGYGTKIHCINCSERATVYIPYGELIKDYLKDKKCPDCKCVGVLY